MSFCCGASMVGAIGTLRQEKVSIHNVPLLFCPVCHQVEVHTFVQEEYDILLDYAESDGAREVNFREYVDPSRYEVIFENCVSLMNHNHHEMVDLQIDMALDLMLVAKQIKDKDWESTLKERLKVFSEKKKTMLAKA